jgi:hypothetical protein
MQTQTSAVALAMADPERKVARKVAADRLGVSDRTLENWAVRGGGPRFIKAGRRVVYRIRDLDDWAAARERLSTSDRGEAA